MQENKQRPKSQPDKPRQSSGFFSLILKQTASAIVCLAVVLGMKNSPNVTLNNCAKSLGRALRHDAKWEESVRESLSRLKGDTPEDTSDTQETDDGGISFR